MEDLIGCLRALSDETRFKIINILLAHNYCVGSLAYSLGISEAAASQHLQVLRRAGLVRGEKRGYWTRYSVERNALNLMAEELKKLAGRPCCREVFSGAELPGKEGRAMCQCGCGCERPEKLKETPEKCTPEQIKDCHGDEKNHPCTEKK